jgi:hypothetical protein
MRGEYVKGIGITIAGGDHIKKVDGCEDAVHIEKRDRTVSVALCDGAGTASHSQIGARTVAKVVADLLVNRFDELYGLSEVAVADLILDAALAELEHVAAREEIELKRLACTLLFVVSKPMKSSVRYIVGNLGDGIVIMREHGEPQVLFEPENGKYANITYFVTSPDARERLRVRRGESKHSNMPGWFISTDGATDLLFNPRNGNLAPVIPELLEDLRVLEEGTVMSTLQQVMKQVIMPRAVDDCGLALLQTVARSAKIPRKRL